MAVRVGPDVELLSVARLVELILMELGRDGGDCFPLRQLVGCAAQISALGVDLPHIKHDYVQHPEHLLEYGYKFVQRLIA